MQWLFEGSLNCDPCGDPEDRRAARGSVDNSGILGEQGPMRKYRRDPEVAAISYMIIKEQGICVRCLANWAELNSVHCWGCQEYQRMRNQRAKKIRRKTNLVLIKGKGA